MILMLWRAAVLGSSTIERLRFDLYWQDGELAISLQAGWIRLSRSKHLKSLSLLCPSSGWLTAGCMQHWLGLLVHAWSSSLYFRRDVHKEMSFELCSCTPKQSHENYFYLDF
jgi:hypothetical protein